MLAVTEIPSGWAGTEATVRSMQRLVEAAKRDWDFIRLASTVVSGCREKDYVAEAQAVFRYCKRNIRYVKDPNNIEMIENPWRTLERGAGDCDSSAVVVAALMECLGIPTAFKTIAGNAATPTEFSHIFTVCLLKGQWIAADLVPNNTFFGYEPKGFMSKLWKD